MRESLGVRASDEEGNGEESASSFEGKVELVGKRTLTRAGRRKSSLTAFKMKGEDLAVARKRIRPRMKTISGVGGFGYQREEQRERDVSASRLSFPK